MIFSCKLTPPMRRMLYHSEHLLLEKIIGEYRMLVLHCKKYFIIVVLLIPLSGSKQT